MAIDRANDTRGYLLGRLFFILEQACITETDHAFSEWAYKTAMNTPSRVFPNLMKLKDGYSQSVPAAQVKHVEQEVSDILCGLEGFPDHLTSQDQARFALGYHHQRQSLKKDRFYKYSVDRLFSRCGSAP